MTRKANLDAALTQIVGAPVEITVRGETDFTFSVDAPVADLEAKLVAFFGALMSVSGETQIDDECGTFVYMRAA